LQGRKNHVACHPLSREKITWQVYFTKDEASIREDQAKAEAERARKAKQAAGLGWVACSEKVVKDA